MRIPSWQQLQHLPQPQPSLPGDLPPMAPRTLRLEGGCSLREGGHLFRPATLRCVYCQVSLGGLIARAQAQGGPHVD